MHVLRSLLLICVCLATVACSVGVPVNDPVTTSATDTPQIASPTTTPTVTPQATATATPLPTVRIQTADEALFAGDYDSAMAEYQAVLNQNPEGDLKAAALLGVGQVYWREGDSTSALEPFRFLIEQFPETEFAAIAYYHLGEIYSSLDRYSEAADAYAQYLTLRPGILDAYIQELRGDALTSAGDTDGANTAYQAARTALVNQGSDTANIDFKIAQNLFDRGDYQGAADIYSSIYTSTSSEYSKARADNMLGQTYMILGLTDQAIAAFQDAVTNFPRAYDSYYSLVTLVEAGVDVSEFQRGLVDYFAGQYSLSINAFDRYIDSTVQTDASAYYYKGLALQSSDSPAEAIAQWEIVIANYPQDRYWASAWEEKAYTQWAYQQDYVGAAETMKAFVAAAPSDTGAADMLFQAGRNYERADMLAEAAQTWEQLASDYSSTEYAFTGFYIAGITRYRMGDLPNALTSFQRALALAVNASEQSTAYMWIGKLYQADHNLTDAMSSYQFAYQLDPTGYYSERARDLLAGRTEFTDPQNIDFSYDLNAERAEAEAWMKTTYNLPDGTDFSGTSAISADARLARGQEYFSLGLYEKGRNELESLRNDVASDPLATYQLMNVLYDMGIYRSAILASRQILSLAGLDDAASLQAPKYFNHIRFGTYFKEMILKAAKEEGVSALLLFALIRQESLFEGFAESSAGAVGLMQIMPDTGSSIAANWGWPANYTSDDLLRPYVSIRLGVHYLAQQLELFDGDVYAALAAYNGGPGNAMAWKELAPDDPDLFLETVRIQETRNYITNIYEMFTIYRNLYGLEL